MRLTAIAHLIAGAILVLSSSPYWYRAALFSGHGGDVGTAGVGLTFLVLGGVLVFKGIGLQNASKHFHRVVVTKGNDISNLRVALNGLKYVYAAQRWSWIVVLFVVLFGWSAG